MNSITGQAVGKPRKPTFRPGASASDLYRDLNFISPRVFQMLNHQRPHVAFSRGISAAKMKVDKAFEMFGKDAEAIAAQKDRDMDTTLSVRVVNGAGEVKVEDISPAIARQLYHISKDEQQRREILKVGQVSEETFLDIERWLNLGGNERHKAAVDGLRAFYDSYPTRIRPVVQEIAPGKSLIEIENYTPTRRKLMKEIGDDLFIEYQPDSKQIKPNNLESRTGGLGEFILKPDYEVARDYAETMEHFIAYGKYVHDASMFMRANGEQLEKAFGKNFTNALQREFTMLKEGARIRNMSYSATGWFNSAHRRAARALTKLPPQYLKQSVGMFTAQIDHSMLPASMSEVTGFLLGDKDSRRLRAITETVPFKTRYGKEDKFGYVNQAIPGAAKTELQAVTAQKWNHWASICPRAGDMTAFLNVANVKMKMELAKGTNEVDALAMGIQEAELSQTTMDPGRITLQAMDVNPSSFAASVLALSQTNFQIFNRYMTEVEAAAIEYQKGNRAKALKKFGAVAFKWHGLVQISYAIAASGATAELKDYLAKILVGPIGDIPVIGDIYNTSYSMFAKFYERATADEDGEKTIDLSLKHYGSDFLLSSMATSFANSATSFFENLQSEDNNRVAKAMLDATEMAAFMTSITTGIPATYVANVANSLYNGRSGENVDADFGLYPWVLALSGYSKKRVEAAQKMTSSEEDE